MILPVFIEQVFVVMLSVVSTFLSSMVSEQAVSAVGVIDGLNLLFTGLFIGVGTGATVIMSQYSGRQEHDKADYCVPQLMTAMLAVCTSVAALILIFSGVICNFLLGGAEPAVLESGFIYLVCISASYPLLGVFMATSGILRGLGDMRTSMNIVIVMNIVNAVVSSVSIFLFDAGVWGIGIGIIMARVAAFFICMYVLRRRRDFKHRLRDLVARPDRSIQRMIFKIGIPIAFERMLFQLGRFVTHTFIIPMGTPSLSSYSVALAIVTVYELPATSLNIAGMTIVGMNAGSGDRKAAQRAAGLLILINSGVLAVLSLALIWFSGWFVSLYGLSGESAEMATRCVQMYLIVSPFLWAPSWVPGSLFKAAGDIRYTTVVAIVSVFTLRVTLGYVFGVMLELKTVGLYIAMFADWFGRALLFMPRFFRKTWIKGPVVA